MLAGLWSATLDVFISPKFYVLGSFVRQRNKPLPLVFPLTCNICLNKWFKPPMFNSRECQGYFQMFLLLKANKNKLFLNYCFKTNKALWFTRTPGFAGGVWHHQGLGFQQLLGHLWQMFVPCQAEQPAGNSRIKRKSENEKRHCWSGVFSVSRNVKTSQVFHSAASLVAVVPISALVFSAVIIKVVGRTGNKNWCPQNFNLFFFCLNFCLIGLMINYCPHWLCDCPHILWGKWK